jgi:hypothetical protein
MDFRDADLILRLFATAAIPEDRDISTIKRKWLDGSRFKARRKAGSEDGERFYAESRRWSDELGRRV